MKEKIFGLIKIVISFGLLGLLFWIMRDDVKGIWRTITTSDLRFLTIGLCIILVNVTMLAYRFKVIFLGENLEITMSQAFQLTLVGYFFNNFMPTAVGGDIVKAYYAGRANNKRLQSYASVFMDRFIGLYTFLLVAAVALIVDRGRFHMEALRTIVFVLIALGVAGIVIVTNKKAASFMGGFFKRLKMMRLGEKLNAVYSIVHDYRNRRDVVIKSFMISILAQSLYFTVVYLFFLSLGQKISPGNIFLIMPVVTFISMLPSIGGLGVREGAFVAFFATLAGRETAFAVSLLLLLSLLVVSFMGGLVYLWWGVSGVRTEKVKEIIKKEKEVGAEI